MKGTLAKLILVIGMLLPVILLSLPERASAIPTFSRRYGTSCTTCHILPPKLNAFGVAFKNNGYRMPEDDEKFIKQPDVDLGAPGWKKLWPKVVWPGEIADRIPLSAAIELVTDVTPNEPVKVNFAFPEEFELLAGGTLSPRFSYFGDLAFVFGGSETKVDFERGHFNMRLTNSPLVNLRLERFETRATPFSRFSHRLTDTDFIVSDFQAIPGGFRDRQQGLELWGAKNGFGGGGLQYGMGLVNGSGSSNDINSQKDFYSSASYKFRGFGATGPARATNTMVTTENYMLNLDGVASLQEGALAHSTHESSYNPANLRKGSSAQTGFAADCHRLW